MPSWIEKLDKFILHNHLISKSDNLIVAVSGGMDSMFLLSYLQAKGYKLTVAHCNFGLRGTESDLDEALVKSYCQTHAILFYSKTFETTAYATQNKLSIQMAARELRYTWFDELCQLNTEGATKIVTAHHKSDHAETILINMLRGTGLRGLEGIAMISGKVIRPMLCLTRDEVETAVNNLKITYRNDKSNESDKYHRNRLRLNVIPELKKINPEFENTFLDNSKIAKQASSFIAHYMATIESELVSLSANQTHICVSELLKKPEPLFILYAILVKFGFNASSVDNIYLAMNGLSGKQFFSNTHVLTINRGQLIIQKKQVESFETYCVNRDTKQICTPHHNWFFEEINKDENQPLAKQEACLNGDNLIFPLSLRPWQQGDKIRPLGMKGSKKVSDVLINKKLSRIEKEQIWVLVSGKDIIWISGILLSDDYKIQADTKKVLLVKISPIAS